MIDTYEYLYSFEYQNIPIIQFVLKLLVCEET